MSKWTQEYKYDLPSAFYTCKLNTPLYLRYLLTARGFACPDFAQGNCLEIGSGKGLGLSIQSACHSSNWYGVEFNPTLVNAANRRAKQCHIQINLSSQELSTLAERNDLPKFDLICLHGVWSWISKEDQELIIDIVAKHLNDGGVFFISYNCSVGMVNFESVRDLMKLYDETNNNNALDDMKKVVNISKFLFPIVELNPSYVVSQPDFANRIQDAVSHPTQFLAENLNTYWSMDHFSEVAKRLERADVGFVCPASGDDNLDEINLTKEQIEFLQPLIGTPLYEETRDFIVNQRFRHDLYIKGAIALSTDEFLNEFAAQNVVLLANAPDFDYTITGRLGQIELDKQLYAPLIEVLSDNLPKNVGQMIDAIIDTYPELNTADLINAVNTLVFAGVCAPALNPELISDESINQCLQLNLHTLSNLDVNEPIFLASPLLQTSIVIAPLDGLLLRKFINTESCSDMHLVEELLTLNVNGVITLTSSEVHTSEEEIIEYTSNLARNFLQTTLPLYHKLMLI